MRVGAFEILLFFICLNLSCFILNEMDALPETVQATETPASINDQFLLGIGSSIAIIMGGVIAGMLVSAVIQGAAVALVIAAISWLVPVADWLFLGFPKMLMLMGLPDPIWLSLQVLIGIVWVWFLIGIVAQRYME